MDAKEEKRWRIMFRNCNLRNLGGPLKKELKKKKVFYEVRNGVAYFTSSDGKCYRHDLRRSYSGKGASIGSKLISLIS